MIRCSLRSCKGPWAHYNCVNMTPEESGEYKKYYCPSCQLEDPKRKNIKYTTSPKKQPGEKTNGSEVDTLKPETSPEKDAQKPEKSPEKPEKSTNSPGKTPVRSNKGTDTSPELPVKSPEKIPARPDDGITPIDIQPIEKPTSQTDDGITPTDTQPIVEPISQTVDKCSQADPDPENDPLLAGLITNFSKELTKSIQANNHLKSIIRNLETEISQHKNNLNEKERLEGDILMLISSNKEKDAHILDLERKLEETVDALQLAKDQLDVATIDLRDNTPNSRLNKLQQIVDTKEKHLNEKTSLLNQPGNTTCDLVIKSQVKIGQKLRPGVKIGSLKNSEGIFFNIY